MWNGNVNYNTGCTLCGSGLSYMREPDQDRAIEGGVDRGYSSHKSGHDLVFTYHSGKGHHSSHHGSHTYGMGLTMVYPQSVGVQFGNSPYQTITNGQTFTVSANQMFGNNAMVNFNNGYAFTMATGCNQALQVGNRFGPLQLVGGGGCTVQQPVVVNNGFNNGLGGVVVNNGFNNGLGGVINNGLGGVVGNNLAYSIGNVWTGAVQPMNGCTLCSSNMGWYRGTGDEERSMGHSSHHDLVFTYHGGKAHSSHGHGTHTYGVGLSAVYPASVGVQFGGSPYQTITNGQTFTVSANAMFGNNALVNFNNGQSFNMATGCSLPLRVGDRYGPLQLVGGGSCAVQQPVVVNNGFNNGFGGVVANNVAYTIGNVLTTPVQAVSGCTLCGAGANMGWFRDEAARSMGSSHGGHDLHFTYHSGRGHSKHGHGPLTTGTGLFAIYPQQVGVMFGGSAQTMISNGQTFTVNANQMFGPTAAVQFSNGHTFNLATSCNVPMVVGDFYGPLELVGGGSCAVQNQVVVNNGFNNGLGGVVVNNGFNNGFGGVAVNNGYGSASTYVICMCGSRAVTHMCSRSTHGCFNYGPVCNTMVSGCGAMGAMTWGREDVSNKECGLNYDVCKNGGKLSELTFEFTGQSLAGSSKKPNAQWNHDQNAFRGVLVKLKDWVAGALHFSPSISLALQVASTMQYVRRRFGVISTSCMLC